jgi:hypothetical protein
MRVQTSFHPSTQNTASKHLCSQPIHSTKTYTPRTHSYPATQTHFPKSQPAPATATATATSSGLPCTVL